MADDCCATVIALPVRFVAGGDPGPEPPDGTEIARGLPASGPDDDTPDELLIVVSRDLRDIANRARRLHYPHVPDRRLIDLLDPKGIHLLVRAYPQTGGFWRCLLWCKLDRSPEPCPVWCDIPADSYARLLDWGEDRRRCGLA